VGKFDPRVDAYIAKSAAFARPILSHLRRLVHAACPSAEETIKWGFPHFMYQGMLCSMAAFKQHCAFGFWHKNMRTELTGGQSTEAMGQLGRITSVAGLPKAPVLKRHIKQAMELNEAGIKISVVRKPFKPIKVPADVMKALRSNKKALATFGGFSPSHRREYLEWIAEAKRAEARAKRIATMLEWLVEGKSRNWKYERR
jgi:uncharacterized protein YdeI (YjbR/CyaY-like superfamily)